MAGVAEDWYFETAREAEAAFYDAFEAADVEAMMAVWDAAEDIVCVHPVGQRLSGVAAVREAWEALFTNPQRMRFRVTDAQYTETDELAVHIVHEHIRIGTSGKQHPPVVATNAYRRTEHGWRMILHHASPTPQQAKEGAETLH